MTDDIDVLIVGAGHGRLGVASLLASRRHRSVIVDANPRVGDSWRNRWPSLRLFTPRFLNGLPGSPFPPGPDPFPTKDEVADYQEAYAARLAVPIRLGVGVSRLRRANGSYEATMGDTVIRARNVVVATGSHHTPRIPAFAARLPASVTQLHSRDYRHPELLPDGPVIVVGANNSGAEIALELSRTHPTTLAVGTSRPLAPRRWRDPRWWRVAGIRGRLLRGRRPPQWLPWPFSVGRFLEIDIHAAARSGAFRLVPRAVDVSGDALRLADGTSATARTVVWATGFELDDSWIDLPGAADGLPAAARGRSPVPGLWFVRGMLLDVVSAASRAVAADIASRAGRDCPS